MLIHLALAGELALALSGLLAPLLILKVFAFDNGRWNDVDVPGAGG